MGKQPPHAGGVGQAGGLHQNHIRFFRCGIPQDLFKLVHAAGAEHGTAGDLPKVCAQIGKEGTVHALFSKFIGN